MKQILTLIVSCLISVGGYAQFCVPTYSTGTQVGDSLVSMTLGTFTANYPAAPAGYSDYTNLATIGLYAGAQNSLTVVNNPTLFHYGGGMD